MRDLPVIPSRPMPAALAVAQLLNVSAAIAIRKERSMSEPFGRVLTPARVAQGFKCQAHLDAFYRHLDHGRECPECQQPGEPMPLDDGLQPTRRECPTGRELFRASLSEHFTPAESRDLPAAGCPRCGQTSLAFPGTTCATCRDADRASQGTQHALFTPGAAPITGQQTL